MLEIPMDKEFAADYRVETRTKLEELTLAAMVLCAMFRIPAPSWFAAILIIMLV